MSSLSAVASGLAERGVAYAPEIARAAARHGVDPALLAAVAAQETGGPGSDAGRNVVGDGGHGRGLFQIDDRWHAFARSAKAMNPAANADYAAGMLRGLLDRYGGNVRDALSAYNAGSPTATGTKTTWADGATLGYADSVLRHYRRLEGGDSPAPATTRRSSPAASPSSADALGALLGLGTFLDEADAERACAGSTLSTLQRFRSAPLFSHQRDSDDGASGIASVDDD